MIKFLFTFFFLQTDDPFKAKVAKVVPTPNNGSSELVVLRRNANREPWFVFQKTKYSWDTDKKQFKGLEFPVGNSLRYYNNWKGYQDSEEVTEAEEKYGKNK